MSAINDGGPAFPSAPTVGPNGDLLRPVDIGCEGASLRDYFAAKAMQGFAAESGWDGSEHMAECAYKWADAMIKARGEA